MSIPKEPRQQMINIMYLVLTALLALNVSSEVLNSFKLINDGITSTNHTLTGKNDVLMAGFKQKYINDEKKTKPYLDDATKVTQSATEMYNYIEGLKMRLVKESGGMEDGHLKGKKDIETTTRILVDQHNGQQLQQKLEQLKTQLVALSTLDDKEKRTLMGELPLTTEYDVEEAKLLDKKDWAEYHFQKVPVVAALALLTKLQGDVNNAESMVLERLDSKIDVMTYKFDNLMAASVVPNSYVICGKQPYKADIFVAATSKTQDAQVFIGRFMNEKAMRDPKTGELFSKVDEFPLANGYTQLTVKGGVANFSEIATSAGVKGHQGVIKVKKPSGDDYDYFPFELKYQAAQSTAVISAEKMNVLYIGLENPLAVSVPGVANDKLTASIVGKGSIKGKDGKFTISPYESGKLMVNISAKLDEGTKPMGSNEFRVKRVPNPIAILDNNDKSTITAGRIKVSKRLNALLYDFVYDVPFEVVGYDVLFQPKRNVDPIFAKSATASLPDDIVRKLPDAKAGGSIYFDNIRVKGPDGIRTIPNVMYRIN